ncbi:MAG: peptidoglycan DD-metalloendopeptidase family protein [Prevotellaceae bacterium]|jgi:septal ring factor EnvC (AmiA/AmiB activator)|nr:peptidoglycan DD-metalloendopeptidase family protein [Prevotellaceae bacterium]
MRLLITLSFLIFTSVAIAQTMADLDRRRKKAEEEIAYIDKLLQQNSTDRKNSAQQLQLIGEKIKTRKQIVAGIDSQIQLMENDVSKKQEEITLLKSHFDTLKKSYEQLLYQACKNRNKSHWLMHILASENIGLAYHRWNYFKHYASYINEQAAHIKQTAEEMNIEIESLNTKKTTLAKRMTDRQREMRTLEKEETEEQKIAQNLSGQEQELARKMADQRKTIEQINKQIEQIVSEQAKKDRQQRQKAAAALPTADKTLSTQFENNRGQLPWPVQKGIITERFGVHYHPVFKNIKMQPNNGIDITTDANSPVQAVFDGEVRRVFTVPGMNNCVMVLHGDYYTLYCKLSTVAVKTGDKVAAGQALGAVFTTDNTVLHFEIWKAKNNGEAEKSDPELWLKKK